MKSFFKAMFLGMLFCRFLYSFFGASFLFFIFIFSCFNFSHFSEAKSEARERVLAQQAELSQAKRERFQKFAQQEAKEERKARGVIVRFHRWPSVKQQKEIVRILKASGLKRTKSIRSFKAQLFEWGEGGLKPSKQGERYKKKKSKAKKLKPSRQGERACLKLKSLSYVRRCSPDHLLPLNSVQSSYFIAEAKRERRSETEAGFSFECKDCKNQAVKSIAEVAKKAVNMKVCGLISDKRKLMEGRLSDYWAQELIGSDLLREELEKTPAPNKEDWIAVFDSQEVDHNIAVKNLISDEGSHAVLPELGGKKTPFLDIKQRGQSRAEYRKGKGYKPALALYETSYPGDFLFGYKKRAPHYINNSMGWGESEDIYEVFQKLSSSTSNTVIVSSSGNGFPSKLDDTKSKASKDYNAVLVGSLSPRGFVSEFSQSGREVHILAPSDDWITSAGNSWDNKPFGGTSGAAPLVTGSLAGFEWLSGYHPTAEEAKILLEKTAFPTLHSHEKPRINGLGLLNAYKLGEVAKRLKEKCRNKSVFCFKEEILKDENYRFSGDKELERDVGKIFPSCSAGEEPGDLSELSSCEEKGELFKKLRKSVLLSPSKKYLESLSCIYKEAGFSQNAEALDKLAIALGTESEVRAELRAMALREKPISENSLRLMLGMGGFEDEFRLFENRGAIRMVAGIGEAGLPVLEKAIETGNLDLQKVALSAAGKLGKAGLPVLEKGFETGKLDLQWRALSAAGKLGETGLPLLEKAFETGNLDLQWQALSAAGGIGEAAALPLLEKGFETGKLDLQKVALSSVGWIGEAGLPLLEKGFETGKPDLQWRALSSAGEIGETGLPLLEKGFETGKLDLQEQVLSSAGKIGEAGLPLLEKGFETGKLDLQKRVLSSAGGIGEAGLPLLEKGFETGNLDLQKRALSAAGWIGEAGLPLLEKAFETGKPDLQELALSVAGAIGEVGLPLLEKAFETGNLDLQWQALSAAYNIGGKAVSPLLRRFLKNKNLDEDIRLQIVDLLDYL